MAKKQTETNGNLLQVPVAFSNVNIGDKTARIGVSIDREFINPKKADDILCDRRIAGTIIAVPMGNQADQGSLPGMDEEMRIDGIFDVKGFSTTTKVISVGLTFALKGLDVSSLALFAKRNGKLVVTGSEALEDEGDDE